MPKLSSVPLRRPLTFPEEKAHRSQGCRGWAGLGRGGPTGRAGGGRCDLGRRKRRPRRPAIGPTPPRRPAAGGGETRRGRAARWLSGREMWAPSGLGPSGWDRRRVGARLRAALAGLQELQGLRATQQARVRGALGLHPEPGPRGQELRLEAALAALREQLVRSERGHEWPRGRSGARPGHSWVATRGASEWRGPMRGCVGSALRGACWGSARGTWC